MYVFGSLRRYTSIPAVLDTLINARITLLNPQSWIDRNDRELMAHYAATTPARAAFAYCMATGNETAHHWQIFADKGGGACIVFDRQRFIEAITHDPLVRHGEVSYVNWRELGSIGRSPERLPFIKRQVFRFEREYRIIATPSAFSDKPVYDVAIPLGCITSVYISGEVPVRHFDVLRKVIRDILGCKRLAVRHSGLLKNPRWSASLQEAVSDTNLEGDISPTP